MKDYHITPLETSILCGFFLQGWTAKYIHIFHLKCMFEKIIYECLKKDSLTSKAAPTQNE